MVSGMDNNKPNEATSRDYRFIARHANAELRASTSLAEIVNRLDTYPPRVVYNADRLTREIQDYRRVPELADRVDELVDKWQEFTLMRGME